MKIVRIFFILLSLSLISTHLYAQAAKIIDVQGQVLIKKDISSDWQKAKINMFLEEQAEVQTKKDAYCTLAFDEELENILTLKENSHIKIESITPGKIFLPEGRVFSLIENIAKAEAFQIRTPTAIAGVRGTGWVIDYNKIKTIIACLNNTINVSGLDKAGNITTVKDLVAGYGLNVLEGGLLEDMFSLDPSYYEEWKNFIDYVNSLLEEGEISEEDSLQDLLDEWSDDFGDIDSERRRKEEEDRADDGGNGGEY